MEVDPRRWSVHPYSIGTLRSLLAEHSKHGWPEDSVHDRYFEDYFGTLGAKAVVVERDYVDHDFLEDFAAYYVRCFKDYARKCTRLHFFRKAVGERDFARLLEERDAADAAKLGKAYLGFLVVRPVPQRCVGRTCLITYSEGSGREYTNLRPYEASLFGLRLEVTTLAFQQQDRTVAECATAALWSAFQATGKLFGHRIPSPAEITQAATRRIPLETRTLPTSGGLSAEQMADAVRACDLEPLHIGATDPDVLRATVYAYAGADVPVVLVGDVVDLAEPPNATEPVAPPSHAVTVTGYNVAAASGTALDRLRSDRIDKLYVHDDAVGPFARMMFENTVQSTLTTSLAATKTEIGQRRFRPTMLLIPLYHKIRIPFGRVLGDVKTLIHFIGSLRASGAPGLDQDLAPCEWDVRLTTVNEYKRDVFEKRKVQKARAVLERPMPRFIWVARATHPDQRGFDLLFDATGIEADDLCFARVDRGSPIPGVLREAGFQPDQFAGVEGPAAQLLGQ